MRFLYRWRIPILALMILGVLYAGGYIYARSQHYLIHRSGSAFGQTDNHRITIGDIGLAYNPAYRTAVISYWVFTPLRWVETGYWYLRHPVGQPWPYGAGQHPRLQKHNDAE